MNRMAISELNQDATKVHLRDLGHRVEQYGQELLSPGARELLRDTRGLDRWLADFLVRTSDGETLLVDAKFSFQGTGNHSIEMRSLLTASREELATWYICSTWDGSGFDDFVAISADDVPTTWPCCAECFAQFQSSPDAKVVNRALSTYCPSTPRRLKSSGTPYFVIPGTALLPFDEARVSKQPPPEIWNAPQQRQLDWRRNRSGAHAPCVVCGRPTSLRNASGQPSHKVCAENAVPPLKEAVPTT